MMQRSYAIRQDFELRRGGETVVRFKMEGMAGATDAKWYCAASDTAAAADRDLVLTWADDQITLTDQGSDCMADLKFVAADVENLPPGYRHHELWATVNGRHDVCAVGTLLVHDSLKA